MLVQKYGGTSVETIDKITKIAKYIKHKIIEEKNIILVLSAMGKTTNNLKLLASKICKNPSKRELDQLINIGENKSIALMSIALNDLGVKAISLTGWQAQIKTNNNFGGAFINKINLQKIKKYFNTYQVVVVAGFQGISKNGDITTLGKGGSDTTAVALASIFGCNCEIFTDVSGIFTLDPKLYFGAKKLKYLSYDNLMEMSANGAKVMETRSVEIAKKYGVDLYVGKSLENEKGGTYVVKNDINFEYMPIKNITAKENVSILNVSFKEGEVLTKVLKILSNNMQKLELFSVVKNNCKNLLSCSVDKELIVKIKKELKEDNIICKINNHYCKITIVGSGFATHSLIAKNVFLSLLERDIEYTNISISEISISFLVRKKDKLKAVECLAKKFDL